MTEIVLLVFVMSTQAKLQKYVDRPIVFHGRLRKQPIIIADSKGNYLRQHGSDIFQSFCHIEFECKGGARFAEYYNWLNRNLTSKVNQFGNIVLFVFLGTCELTKISTFSRGSGYARVKRYIELRHSDDNTAFSYVRGQIDRFYQLVSNYPTVSIVFLEIPPYSIQEWNKYQGHPDPKSFLPQDLKLYERISIINDYIKLVNEFSSVKSPRFDLDLKRTRKSQGDSHRRTSLNFSNYKDGIHPKPLLARVWMKRILLQIFADCA